MNSYCFVNAREFARVVIALLVAFVMSAQDKAWSQAHAAAHPSVSRSGLSRGQQFLYTDITDTGRREATGEEDRKKPPRLKLLPSGFFYSAQTECSQRLETNIFQTSSNPRPDYVFRTDSDLRFGYETIDHHCATGCYVDYQVLKDIFAANGAQPSFPTNQVLSGAIYRDLIPLNLMHDSTLRFELLSREVWIDKNNHQADLIPSLYGTRWLHPKGQDLLAFGALQLPMRSLTPFEGAKRELDPAYTAGLLLPPKKGWSTICSATILTNFRSPPFKNSNPTNSNQSIICDLEFDHDLPFRPMNYGTTTFFLTFEPLWNFGTHNVTGLSGFDFRLYTGLRYSAQEPSNAKPLSPLFRRKKTVPGSGVSTTTQN